jgi:FkbM family methyltransferase
MLRQLYRFLLWRVWTPFRQWRAARRHLREVRRQLTGFPARTVERTYGAGPLKVRIADPTGAEWYDHDWAELPEVALFRGRRLRPGARVFDFGGHQGVVAMMLAREVGPTGRVIAFEPNPHNGDVLRTNLELNGVRNVELVRAAVADRAGTAVFNDMFNGILDPKGSFQPGRITVRTVSVDDTTATHGPPDVVFLDVEGAECMALSGAARTLASGADFFVEVHVGCGLEALGGSARKVFEFFPADRFEWLGRAEEDTAFRPITPDDPLTAKRFFLLALPRTVSPA